MCTFIFMYVHICKGYIQNFSLWYATICLFVFVKWVFTTSPRLWGPCDSSDSTSDITAQARASIPGFRQLLWKPLRPTSRTFICMCVGLYVSCLNTLEDSRRGTVGRGSVCHSAPASKHTCVYESVGKDIMAEARNAWPRLMITTLVIQKSSIFPHMKYLQMQNLGNWNPYIGPQ